MSSHSKGNYIAVYGDLSPADGDYSINVYKRRVAGGAFIKGRWRDAKSFPNDFWDKETAREVVRYFVLEVKGWDRKATCENLTTRLLRDNLLAGVCKQFRSSTIEIMDYCFPEWEIKPWELQTCPNSFWNEPSNCARACLWVAQREGIAEDREAFCRKFSARMLRDYGIGKAMVRMGGLYEVANVTFPEWNLKPWHLRKVGKITEPMVAEAVTWMIDQKLGWSHKDVCENICVKTFYDHGIGKILMKGCNHSPIRALEIAYPGQYERSMLRNGENPFRK